MQVLLWNYGQKWMQGSYSTMDYVITYNKLSLFIQREKALLPVFATYFTKNIVPHSNSKEYINMKLFIVEHCPTRWDRLMYR